MVLNEDSIRWQLTMVDVEEFLAEILDSLDADAAGHHDMLDLSALVISSPVFGLHTNEAEELGGLLRHND